MPIVELCEHCGFIDNTAGLKKYYMMNPAVYDYTIPQFADITSLDMTICENCLMRDLDLITRGIILDFDPQRNPISAEGALAFSPFEIHREYEAKWLSCEINVGLISSPGFATILLQVIQWDCSKDPDYLYPSVSFTVPIDKLSTRESIFPVMEYAMKTWLVTELTYEDVMIRMREFPGSLMDTSGPVVPVVLEAGRSSVCGDCGNTLNILRYFYHNHNLCATHAFLAIVDLLPKKGQSLQEFNGQITQEMYECTHRSIFRTFELYDLVYMSQKSSHIPDAYKVNWEDFFTEGEFMLPFIHACNKLFFNPSPY